jgi:hypothetical protein
MPYSLAEAAAACGLNKTTILRAIKAGKISGTKDEHGGWFVEPAELHRVYPPIAADAEAADAAQRDATPPDAELRLRASLAEQRLSDLKAALDDMREQRDKWQAQAERLAAGFVTDQRQQRPWWRRLAG